MSATERIEIAHLHAKKYSIRTIAIMLGRGKSSIAEELKRNLVQGIYDSRKAQHKAYVRRKYAKYQGMKIVEDQILKNSVDTLLWDDQSPRAIAGKLGRISKASIYRYIQSPYGRKIESHRNRFKRRRHQGVRTKRFFDRVSIKLRPGHIARRMRIGHAEGDFIVSGKSGKGILLVVVDRKTRTVFLEKISKPSCQSVLKVCLRIRVKYPEWRSMTVDNDILFQKHQELAETLGIKIYFCQPYHAWEKGSVENVNRCIRKFVPKGSNIAKYSKRFFCGLEEKLNRRILEVLGFRTPNEARKKYMKQKQRREAQGKCPD